VIEFNFSKDEIDDFYIQVGKKVKRLRELNNMTQLELSYAMGYRSVSLVSAAELYKNKKHFNLEHIYKMSKIFNIEISEFFIK
jgi:transcriptional regulator with XRE-family HTH domain